MIRPAQILLFLTTPILLMHFVLEIFPQNRNKSKKEKEKEEEGCTGGVGGQLLHKELH